MDSLVHLLFYYTLLWNASTQHINDFSYLIAGQK